ncbi:DNA-binding helix-turn-helix protein, partial [Leptospira kirschneri serovar Mozdok]
MTKIVNQAVILRNSVASLYFKNCSIIKYEYFVI